MKKSKIVLYTDVLCGWCYGFSPVISKIYEEYHETIDFEIVSGGLFLGNSAGLINQVAPHIIQGAYKSVENLTGVTFGDAFLNGPLKNGTMILNSAPPAIALCIVKEFMPEKIIEFTDLLHKAIYYDGMDSEDIPAYGKYAAIIGFNPEDFTAKMKDSKYYEKALADFNTYNSQQINGFPTVVLQANSQKIILNRGYINYENFKKRLQLYIN